MEDGSWKQRAINPTLSPAIKTTQHHNNNDRLPMSTPTFDSYTPASKKAQMRPAQHTYPAE